MTNKLVRITDLEYKELILYKRDCEALLKFLAINYSDIYMSFIKIKMENVEKRLKILESSK
jgi:hypothetical protein